MQSIARNTLYRTISLGLLLTATVSLVGLEIRPLGWVILVLSVASLLLTDKKFAKDILLITISLAILGLTPISTDLSNGHSILMGIGLTASILVPYLISRYVFKNYQIHFSFHHGRKWYKKELAYIGLTAIIAYLVLPFYMVNSGAYLNWSSGADANTLTRLFVGVNAVGEAEEFLFIGVVFGLLRYYIPFIWANIFQATLWTSFLFSLGFTGWGPLAVFPFALSQGLVFERTKSLLYIVTIHFVVDIFLFLAIIHAHHRHLIDIFLT